MHEFEDSRAEGSPDLEGDGGDDDRIDALALAARQTEIARESDEADKPLDPVLAAETAAEAWAAWRREQTEDSTPDAAADDTPTDPAAPHAQADDRTSDRQVEGQVEGQGEGQADSQGDREGKPDASAGEPRADAAPVPPARPNVVPLRPNHPLLRLVASQTPGRDEPGVDRARAGATAELSAAERNAFREIARTLGARPSDERVVADKPEPGDEDDGFQTQAERDAALAEFLAELGDDPHDLRPNHESVTPAAQSAAAQPSAAGSPATEAPAPVFGALATERDLITAELARNGSTMLDRLPVGVLVSRGDVPIYANRTLLDLLDFADLESLHKAGGVAFMFRGREAERLNHVAEGGAIPVVARDGHVLSVDVRIQSIEWDGDAASLFTIRRSLDGELGQRVKTLELDVRTRQAEARELHAILDTATDGVVVLDEEGRVLAMNRSAEALFGYDQNEVAGDGFALLFSPQSQKSAADYLDGLKSNGVASVLNDGREVIGRERQGGAIPLFMTIGRISTSGPAKFCAVLRDMTHWKKAERQLEEAKRDAERASAMKSDFLAKISHEIRTPLNAIIGFAEVIMEERFGPVGNERYKDYLKDIHASGTHVMSLVNDLLDLSKIEAGKLDLNFGSVDANRIVSECVSLMQPQALQERVILRVSLAPRLPQIVADERSLRQIVLNLLSNALKFNEPGGQVIVSTALTDAGHAVIRIRDTGIGMSDEEIEIALEPFRQIATARQRGGTGLGLPLTKALVEANRASFTIKSKKREGTLVEIAFPPTRVLAE
ncbi:MAG: PAS domain S-box protein [Rhizobiales bacterium]|nr:PAS domain S-box protein [Hyphomicrobiales bacterium]